ncbi:hypothetical protein [Phycicoccus sonneratiae]|uniref:Uncharacterized protein n=1 Tax=Phycicoccus sonneratiae TaxID=2807628 RepID=A0ABS2CRR3_9MICO|nr:hypothetical protein [Phycicoccus sonneraticus]MBM6401784.1 hypothetical protein [Phycicoccus sonneraticus]
MALNWKALAKLGLIPPEAWDAVIPHGHLVARGVGRLDVAALNPQPLPPKEAEVGADLLRGVLLGAIIVVGGRDGAGKGFLDEVDDWCGTGWPRRWPRPVPPKGWDDGQVFAAAAVTAAALAAQYDHDPEMQEALGAAAERLLEQAGA